MSKPKKTISELETLIKKEAAKTMSLPKNLVVSIWPAADSPIGPSLLRSELIRRRWEDYAW